MMMKTRTPSSANWMSCDGYRQCAGSVGKTMQNLESVMRP